MHKIVEVISDDQIAMARVLFQEYADSIGIDLCFQGFAKEMRELPGLYSPPEGGLFIAFNASEPVGCVAFRPLDTPGAAELKRLYVRPSGRGLGLGLALAQHAIVRARASGYRFVRLDTLSTMQDAQRLYRRLGFKEIPPYTYNPIPEVVYMELDLGSDPA
jgi:putative acetyltransferase